MTQTLLFIRHAQTDLAGTFCGHTDPPLNQTGRAQLQALLQNLSPYPIDQVHSSDLERARATARAIANPRHLPVQTTPALRELHFGAWESLTWEAIEALDKPAADRWILNFPTLPAPGGEPILDFRARIHAEIERLRTLAPAANLAVVTHAGPLRVLLEDFAHFSPHHAWERTRDYTALLHCTQTSPTSPLEVHP